MAARRLLRPRAGRRRRRTASARGARRCPTTVLRALHRRRRPRRLAHAPARARRASTRSRPRRRSPSCFSPLVGTPLTTSAKFAVVAKSPLTGHAQRRARLQPLRDRRQADRPRRDRRRGACAEPSVLLIDGDGARLEPRRRPLGPARRRGRGGAARAARQGVAGRVDRPRRRAPGALRDGLPRRPARRPRRPRRRARREALKAVAVRAGDEGRARRPARRAGRRDATCAPARSARPPRSTASSARWPTCWRSTRSPRCRRATSSRARSTRRRALAAEDLAEARGVARDSCASCTIGCEHIYSGAGGRQHARGVRERVRARPAVRRRRPRRRARRQRAAATSSASTPSPPAARSPGRWSAPSAG